MEHIQDRWEYERQVEERIKLIEADARARYEARKARSERARRGWVKRRVSLP